MRTTDAKGLGMHILILSYYRFSEATIYLYVCVNILFIFHHYCSSGISRKEWETTNYSLIENTPYLEA